MLYIPYVGMELQSLNIKYDKQKLSAVVGQAVDFLLPPLCPATGDIVDKIGMVSPQFWQGLSFIHAPYCKRCGLPFAYDMADALCAACLDHPPCYHTARSALNYDDHSRDIILKFKHGDHLHAARAFVPWLITAGNSLITQADIITPVPLHQSRLVKRRFNQADIMARHLMPSYPGKIYIPDLIHRIRATESQGHKKAKDREKNIRKAFAVNPKYRDHIIGKTILVIDDVYTTGATVNECARVLYDGDAAQVDILTLARVVKD